MSADTLAKDCLGLMEEAGVDISTYGAHSVRGAAASAHVTNGEQLDAVMNTGDRNSNAFNIFYNRGEEKRLPSINWCKSEYG